MKRSSIYGLFFACMPVAAMASISEDTLQRYGGEYATDCAMPQAPRLRVTAAALIVEVDGKRATGTDAQAAFSFFGKSPPPNYRVAFMAEVRATPLLFVVYEDKSGLYARVEDSTPEVDNLLGGQLKSRFSKCITSATPTKRNEKTQAVIPPTASAERTQAIDHPSRMLADKAFRNAYYAALGSKADQRWLVKLEGPAKSMRPVKAEGGSYTLIAVCKAHDCGDNNMVALYSKETATLYGRIYERGQSTVIGRPSADMTRTLVELGHSEWGH